MRRPAAPTLLVLLLLALAWPSTGHAASYAGAPVKLDGLHAPARVQGRDVALATKGGFAPRFWPGVNLGVTVPGTYPGELAATRADFDRWLEGMHELGAKVVRVYTIQRPAFYEALADFNGRHRSDPVRLIQGVWIPEEELLATKDAYAPVVTEGFRREIGNAVAAVHGDISLPLRRGHAGGRYRTSVARWLLAWSIGVEWDPETVMGTDAAHAGQAPHAGRYVTASASATPFESWLASMLDHLATLEAQRGWTRPVTFTNWLTVDPLHHPYEPLEMEDAVSVDAKHVAATDAWPGGFFASYHAYPYYPDFLRFEYRAAPDPYAAYLAALRAHHGDQALMITEFGVPTGIGVAHEGPLGRDQGGHDERKAGRINASMAKAIKRQGYAGAVVFEWIDEWFKFSWNTIRAELPGDRRALWANALTNEEHFGIIAAEPGAKGPVVVVDGRDGDWANARGARTLARARGRAPAVRAVHDEAWLHLALRWQGARSPVTLRFKAGPATAVRLVVGAGASARLEQQQPDGSWKVPALLLSRALHIPATGEDLPPVERPVGVLRPGTSDPRSPRFDSRTGIAAAGRVVEMRIPWALLGFGDPSSRTVLRADGTGTAVVPGIDVAVGEAGAPKRYAWRTWTRVDWHERRKGSWGPLRAAFGRLAR